MIIVKITINALPDKQKEVMQTLLSMIETAEQEKGCLSYAGFCDLEDDFAFSLVGEWATRKDLNRHVRSEKFSVLLGTKSLLTQPLGIAIYTVSLSEGEDVVRTLRGQKALQTGRE